jgi:transcriptional regulator with XRE-family HTH domain
MQLVAIKDTAKARPYPLVMTKARPSTKEILALNLKRLMGMRKWTQVKMAQESGVSQTHISAILRGDSSCTVETADALAKPFNLTGWHLLIARLPDNLVSSPSLNRLVEAYIDATEDGREFLDAAVDRELKRK